MGNIGDILNGNFHFITGNRKFAHSSAPQLTYVNAQLTKPALEPLLLPWRSLATNSHSDLNWD